MKKINPSKLFTLLLIPFVILGFHHIKSNSPSTVRAFAHLNVDFGVPNGDPIFEVSGMLPGDCFTRSVSVENSADFATQIAVRSTNETDFDFISRVLTMQISENSTLLYDKFLEDFFNDSDSLDGVPLSTLPAETATSYDFEICFNPDSGNEYQNTLVIFDLTFGEVISPINLPAECSHLSGIISFVIEGTEGNDDIKGTKESELILGLGGHDEIDGKGGNDCIVGGEGNDNELDGGTGEDVILGGPGRDSLEGGTNEDRLYGGEGNDELEGSSSDDFLDGGPGRDVLDGGTGEDTCINGEILDSCEI